VKRHLGGPLLPIATLGPREVVFDNLLPSSSARWCLRPITTVELLVIPRKVWVETLRQQSVTELRELASSRASFFYRRLEHVVAQMNASLVTSVASKRTLHSGAPVVSLDSAGAVSSPRPRKLSPTKSPSLMYRERNAYEPIEPSRMPGSARGMLRPGASPRRPGVHGLPPLHDQPSISFGGTGGGNSPTMIRVHHSSTAGKVPLPLN